VAHETHRHEYKSSWRDEWLKWICGFANSQGGVLEIGKDDTGQLVGLHDAKKLSEDVPGKITSTMGIVADVEVKCEDGLDYLVVTVRPYPNPISYHGKYYLRSGATNRELNGPALVEFLLRKEGKTWDGLAVPDVRVSDLSKEALDAFRRMALARQRLTDADVSVSDTALLRSLQLMDGSHLKKAAILLFHSTPEQWATGCEVKVGFFLTGADLRFQDELHGPLITIVDRVIDLLYTKYLMAYISYEGIYRRETFPVPVDACREAILNAVVHKAYHAANPIQIKVMPDRLIIFNAGKLPDGWTVETLTSPHESVAPNPDIARTFFRSGQIEAWGRGIRRIEEACAEAGVKPLVFSTLGTTTMVATFMFNPEATLGFTEPRVREEGTEKGTVTGTVTGTVKARVNSTQRIILNAMLEDPGVTATVLAELTGVTLRGVRKSIKTLRDVGLVDREGSDRSGSWIVNREALNG
jgi:ATP-dependent DNA helicase RecG